MRCRRPPHGPQQENSGVVVLSLMLRSGDVWVLSWLVGKIRWVSTAFTRMVTQWIGFCRLRSFSHVRVGSRKIEVLPIDLGISV